MCTCGMCKTCTHRVYMRNYKRKHRDERKAASEKFFKDAFASGLLALELRDALKFAYAERCHIEVQGVVYG